MKQTNKVIETILGFKQDKPVRFHGTTGILINGSQVVEVPNRPNFIYIRLNNNDSEIIEAFNNVVSQQYGLPVIIEHDKQQNIYKVIDINSTVFISWNSNPYLPQHGHTHSMGETDNFGTDPVFIYKKQLLQPLGVVPYQGMTPQLFGDFYNWNGQILHFPSQVLTDFSSSIPTGGSTTNARFITVYLDGDASLIKYETGTDFLLDMFTTGVLTYIPEIPTSSGIALAGVLLTTGTYQVQWDEIYDIRNFLNPGGTASHVHATERWGISSGTQFVGMAYEQLGLIGVRYNGFTIDTAIYSMISGGYGIYFTNPFMNSGILLAEYIR